MRGKVITMETDWITSHKIVGTQSKKLLLIWHLWYHSMYRTTLRQEGSLPWHPHFREPCFRSPLHEAKSPQGPKDEPTLSLSHTLQPDVLWVPWIKFCPRQPESGPQVWADLIPGPLLQKLDHSASVYTPRLEWWPREAAYRAYRQSLDMHAEASTVCMQWPLKGGSE